MSKKRDINTKDNRGTKDGKLKKYYKSKKITDKTQGPFIGTLTSHGSLANVRYRTWCYGVYVYY